MILVIGAGVAGLTAVQHLAAANEPVTLVTAGRFGTDGIAAGNTALAQGGIAGAVGPDDSPELHMTDTIAAGAGLVDRRAASVLATDGAHRLNVLLDDGFAADRDTNGHLELGMEAAHSTARVLHAGEDNSGAALSAFLTSKVQQLINAGAVGLIEQAHLTALCVADGAICGIAYETPSGRQRLNADAVVLATGGYAGLYSTTSSSAAVTGDGLLAAARAGAVVADLEFVQFHPTVLPTTGELISEAVRGAGAVLRDPNGERFMDQVHPGAELAPRDVVSRASTELMRRFATEHIWLDATVVETHFGAGTLATRFPTLTQRLAAQGIDWSHHYVPVAPAAHYCMGGVATDTFGRSSIPGLFGAGEVASTGVHGANRLASNSLLEGLVFGARTALAAQQYRGTGVWATESPFRKFIDAPWAVPAQRLGDANGNAHQLTQLRSLVGAHLGIPRDAASLQQLQSQLNTVQHPLGDLVSLMATAAESRTESRGGHWRADYPDLDSRQARRSAWRLNTTQQTPHDAFKMTRGKEKVEHVNA